MTMVKRSSGEIKQKMLTDLARLTDTVHFNYWPVLVDLARGARLQKDVVDFMIELGKPRKGDFFNEKLNNGGFGSRYIPLREASDSKEVAPIASGKDFYDFLKANDILKDKNAHKAILVFALHTNIEQIKRFASGESLVADAIRRE